MLYQSRYLNLTSYDPSVKTAKLYIKVEKNLKQEFANNLSISNYTRFKQDDNLIRFFFVPNI